jgi:putative transposase
MSQSLARNLIHLVFSTKHRAPLITGELHPTLFAYLVGACKEINCPAIIAGGVADHVHILFALHKTVALCKAVEEIKKESSKWAKENGGPLNFYWQMGYGAFSVSPQNVPQVSEYIARQAEHHAATAFQDEFRTMLRLAGEEWDERYVWD